MKNLVLRTVTGVAFVAVMTACILYSPNTMWLLFLAITALTTWEFTGLVNKQPGVRVIRPMAVCAAVLLYTAFSYMECDLPESRLLLAPWLLCNILILAEELYLGHNKPLDSWAYAMMAQIYIAVPFTLLTVMDDRIYVMAIFLFLWCNDSGAYCTGSLIGRHKLCPRVSPGKTWEGSIGGCVLAMACAAVMWHVSPAALTLPEWLGFALITVVAGTVGDLVESLFKRKLGIKDSGNILPGHGGMLDRFDSSLLAIPAVVAYLFLLETLWSLL